MKRKMQFLRVFVTKLVIKKVNNDSPVYKKLYRFLEINKKDVKNQIIKIYKELLNFNFS